MHPLEKRFPDGNGDKEPLMRECPPALLSEEAVVPFSMPVLVEEADGNGAVSECMQRPQTRLLHTCVT